MSAIEGISWLGNPCKYGSSTDPVHKAKNPSAPQIQNLGRTPKRKESQRTKKRGILRRENQKEELVGANFWVESGATAGRVEWYVREPTMEIRWGCTIIREGYHRGTLLLLWNWIWGLSVVWFVLFLELKTVEKKQTKVATHDATTLADVDWNCQLDSTVVFFKFQPFFSFFFFLLFLVGSCSWFP